MKKLILLATLLAIPSFGFSNDEEVNEDVSTIDGIINAYYEVVSGPKGFVYDLETDRLIHAPNAIITRFNENNDFQRHTLTEEHKPLLEPYTTSLYEIEVSRVSQQYGNIAHVWSTFAMMVTLESEPFLRGINSISLYYKDGRWWIASWETQYESDTKVPKKYLPN